MLIYTHRDSKTDFSCAPNILIHANILNHIRHTVNNHRGFWAHHPALFMGISALLGIGSALFSLPLWISIAWIIYGISIQKWAAICLLPLTSFYAWLLLGNLPILEEPLPCSAYFSISSLQPHSSPFHKNLIYKGTLYFEQKALPCTVIWKQKERLIANRHYMLTGTLIQRDRYDYLCKVAEYQPIQYSWSLAELRYQAKETFRSFLQIKLSSPRTALLLSSLATGDVDDRLLRFEFGRLGLQHLLAISGFHFGILLLFLSFILGWFLPHRWKWAAMLLLMTIYFLFIGPSPAVQRAWIVASLVLLSKILRRHTNPLNLLGSALLIELILDPLIASNLGFQLSFGSCFGILMLYAPLEQRLRALLPKRPTHKSIRLPLFSQALFISANFFRSALSITLAVNLAILPLLFYHFGRFPLLSLLYNLFFPFFISLALFALLAALLLHLLAPPIAAPLFSLLDWFTKELLELTTYPPLLLDHSLYCPEFPLFLVPLYLFILFAYSIRFSTEYESIY